MSLLLLPLRGSFFFSWDLGWRVQQSTADSVSNPNFPFYFIFLVFLLVFLYLHLGRDRTGERGHRIRRLESVLCQEEIEEDSSAK